MFALRYFYALLRQKLPNHLFILPLYPKGGFTMQFTSYLQDGQLTIALTGEIDHHYAKKYIQAIAAKIDAYMPRVCILDFQEVNSMD